MNVIIAHAPQDLAQAEALAAVLRQRGFLAALETGERALLPLTPNDAVVGLISKDFAFSLYRLRLEKRLLDAWADGQLVGCIMSFPRDGRREADLVQALVISVGRPRGRDHRYAGRCG